MNGAASATKLGPNALVASWVARSPTVRMTAALMPESLAVEPIAFWTPFMISLTVDWISSSALAPSMTLCPSTDCAF